jgi:hypothetical protein
MPVETVDPVVVVVVAGTFPPLLLAGPTARPEEDCPPVGTTAVLEAAAPPVEQ